MKHLALLMLSIISIEILFRLKFSNKLYSTFQFSKKASHVLMTQKISDHWKEKIIPFYALRLMILSIKILFIFIAILSGFIITSYFIEDFILYTLSLIGIFETLFFSIIYFNIRKHF